MAGLHLNERQQAAVAAALTIVSVCIILLFLFGIVVTISRFWDIFSGVFMPLIVAGILAMILKPYYTWLLARVRHPIAAIGIVYLSILVPLVGFGWFFGARFVNQLAELFDNIPVWLDRMWHAVEEKWPRLANFLSGGDFEAMVKTTLQQQTHEIATQLKNVVMPVVAAGAGFFRFVAGALGWFVTPVYLAYFLMARPIDKARLENQLSVLKPGTRDDLIYLAHEFVNVLVAFFRGQFLIAFIEGAIFATAFMLGGLNYGLFLGLLLGLLNVVPYLGTFVGLAAMLPLAFSQEGGGIGLVTWVLCVFVAVQTLESYFLTPRIMGNRTGLHPVTIIVAMFFWGTALGGIGGMILAIPLTAFLVVFWRLLKEKYIKAVV